jgi:hypothetical protein
LLLLVVVVVVMEHLPQTLRVLVVVEQVDIVALSLENHLVVVVVQKQY